MESIWGGKVFRRGRGRHFVLQRFWRFPQQFTPPPTLKKIKTWIYHYITWVEIDHKCNKLTDSMHGYLKRLTSLYVSTNKHMSTPDETICHFPVARVAWAVCSAESHRNWQRRHESLLPPYHTRYIPRQSHRKWTLIGHLEPTWRRAWSFVVFCRKNFTPHSQHRHADNASTITMSRPNVRAHRRGLVTACHACETIF